MGGETPVEGVATDVCVADPRMAQTTTTHRVAIAAVHARSGRRRGSLMTFIDRMLRVNAWIPFLGTVWSPLDVRFAETLVATDAASPDQQTERSLRAPRSSRWVIPAIVATVLVRQGAVAVDVNGDYGFYPSWSSLFGIGLVARVLAQGARLGLNGLAAPHRPVLRVSQAASDTGRYERVTVKGARSGVTQRVTAIVAVSPEINVALPMDAERTDYPGSVQAFTWLNQDVRNWATSRLRVTTDGRRWSAMGWSTGGYCPALLHLRAPDRFGAGASVEGYFNPEPDSTTGNLAQLLKQDAAFAHESSPTWLVLNRPPPSVHLLVMTSQQDPQSRSQSLQFLGRARDVPGIQPYVVKGLGHTLDAYAAVVPPILDWLADVAAA